MKRATLFINGSDVDGKVVKVTRSMEELISVASKKFNVPVQKIFTVEGGEIEEVELIRDNDILYVSTGEPFIRLARLQNKNPESSFPCVTKGEWVTLNIGGKYFITSRSTLAMKEPKSILTKMLFCDYENSESCTRDVNGVYVIDRTPAYFEPLLNYLRTNEVIINGGVNPYGVLEEAKYFRIESIIPALENIIMHSQYYRDTKPLTRRDVINVLMVPHESTRLQFQGINFTGADLSRLNLRNKNFKYANLSGCRLTETDLSYCNFEEANLSHAVLDRAKLSSVNMLRANLQHACLLSCTLGRNVNMEAANLEGSNLDGSIMVGANLKAAKLKNATLRDCDLRTAVLAGADLENCDLTGSKLQETNLRTANLKGASIECD